jgi:hypothetical protein
VAHVCGGLRGRSISRVIADVRNQRLNELEIRSVDLGIAVPECSSAAAIGAERQSLFGLPQTACDIEMVLEILARAGEVLDYGDTVSLQLFVGSDPGLHEQFRRVDGAERYHDL